MVETDIDRRVGARVRELRTERGLTLDGLAREAGVSRAMLSRVERGESSPTAQLLVKIGDGLGVTLSALFDDTKTHASALARRTDQPTWRDPVTGYLRRNVSPSGTGSPVDVVEVEFPPGRSVTFDSREPAGWDQHVWMLDGTLEVTYGEETFRLERGDCVRTLFDRPITFRNDTARTVHYAVVVSHKAIKP
jgi:transcriptional regulator with XRE-family HTH domain